MPSSRSDFQIALGRLRLGLISLLTAEILIFVTIGEALWAGLDGNSHQNDTPEYLQAWCKDGCGKK